MVDKKATRHSDLNAGPGRFCPGGRAEEGPVPLQRKSRWRELQRRPGAKRHDNDHNARKQQVKHHKPNKGRADQFPRAAVARGLVEHRGPALRPITTGKLIEIVPWRAECAPSAMWRLPYWFRRTALRTGQIQPKNCEHDPGQSQENERRGGNARQIQRVVDLSRDEG